jgi:7-cyano-7-deazaguanine reductase
MAGMNTPEQSALGKTSAYPDQYDPSLLFPLARMPKRQEIGIGASLPFMGADLWTAYELSWLNARGRPQVAIAQLVVPCETPSIIESKSLKLYLGSFSNSRFGDAGEVLAHLKADLGQALWQTEGVQTASVGIRLIAPDDFDQQDVQELDGVNLDRLDIDCEDYTPAPQWLTAAFDEQPVSEVLSSRLLKSNCLVTGQPDWGSVQISYSGPQIEQGGLLRYLVSFRNHHEFHEQCVERIFMDVWTRCKPTRLAVYARYTRRGGLDINPFRTSHPQALPPSVRTARQ